MDFSVGFEPRWSSDHLSEKKERIHLVGFPRNSSISSGSRWNVGGFGQGDAEIVLQDPLRIQGLLLFFASVVLAQIFLVLKKKQF